MRCACNRRCLRIKIHKSKSACRYWCWARSWQERRTLVAHVTPPLSQPRKHNPPLPVCTRRRLRGIERPIIQHPTRRGLKSSPGDPGLGRPPGRGRKVVVTAEAKRSDQQRTLPEQHKVWALHSTRTVGCVAASVREGAVRVTKLWRGVASTEQHPFVFETPQARVVCRCLVQLQSQAIYSKDIPAIPDSIKTSRQFSVSKHPWKPRCDGIARVYTYKHSRVVSAVPPHLIDVTIRCRERGPRVGGLNVRHRFLGR